jgi:hypothetical protein
MDFKIQKKIIGGEILHDGYIGSGCGRGRWT